MPGSRISRSRAMPARSRPPIRSAKNASMRRQTSPARDRAARARPTPPAACMTTSRHAPRPGRDRSPGRESPDVVQIRDAARQRETLRLRAVQYRPRAACRCRPAPSMHRVEPADFLVRRNRLGRDIAGRGAEFDDIGAVGGERGAHARSPPPGSRNRPPSENKSAVMLTMPTSSGPPARTRHHSARAGCVRGSRRPPRHRRKTSSFSTSTRTCADPRIGETGVADPRGKALAQIDMAGRGDLADRGDDFLVIDDAAAVVAGKRRPRRSRSARPRPAPAAGRSRSARRMPMLHISTRSRTTTV